ncbi:hypothetical protein [Streptomyces lasiicapitis]|uniref:Uncharacterized protein n=1 Tax=Streptomyces lasiicapitis TaxID=1923961 RepID=A0ABQ2MRG9_9ACTN|nr:hypothetical protein [Streptomyces lasiicapitis]GGO57229.1 hypothetical protein GCM10012286_73570 [Streptomyces lasiicapitis]
MSAHPDGRTATVTVVGTGSTTVTDITTVTDTTIVTDIAADARPTRIGAPA